MLNETASARDDRPVLHAPPPRSEEDTVAQTIREMVASVLAVEDEAPGSAQTGVPPGASPPLGRFAGRLLLDSEAAYEQLDQQLAPLNLLALFREENNRHVIYVITGRITPRPRAWWPNLLLLLATAVSVLLVGTSLALSEIAVTDPALADALTQQLPAQLWRGLPYALSILLILGAHELGHYFAARYHKLAVTLPYFIPLPFISPFGTLGAFIQLRQPMRNRKVLLDVGAAGPLTGLVFAVPILLIGLSMARVGPITPGGVFEGDSVLYALAKTVIFGQYLPAGGLDVYITSSQLAWAGWTGLLVSALNLIPVGQLDGGHIAYALLGERARWLYYPLIAVMVALVLVTDVWLLWVLLLLFFGRVYATPLDMITPLDRPRRLVAVASLVILLLIFVPVPLSETYTGSSATPLPGASVQVVPQAAPAPDATAGS
jgi:Zn-dependent protease